jgi:hypothetical protein
MTHTIYVEYHGLNEQSQGRSVDAKDYDDAMRVMVRISMQGLTFRDGAWVTHIPPYRIARLYFLDPRSE